MNSFHPRFHSAPGELRTSLKWRFIKDLIITPRPAISSTFVESTRATSTSLKTNEAEVARILQSTETENSSFQKRERKYREREREKSDGQTIHPSNSHVHKFSYISKYFRKKTHSHKTLDITRLRGYQPGFHYNHPPCTTSRNTISDSRKPYPYPSRFFYSHPPPIRSPFSLVLFLLRFYSN